MNGKGRVRGILIEGRDGHEYLLGFGQDETTRAPTLSRRQPDGTFALIDDTWEASRVAATQFERRGGHLIGPGWGKDLFLWGALKDALQAFPAIPSWPTYRPRPETPGEGDTRP